MRAAASGVLCAWVVVSLEWVAVTLARAAEFAGGWEVLHGGLALLPMAFAFAGVLGVLGSGALSLLKRSDERAARLGLTACVALLAVAAAWAISTGRHFELMPRRLSFVGGVAALAVVVAYRVAPPLGRVARSRPRRFALGVLGTVLALELLNRFVFVRLYPGFHASLAVLTLLAAPGLAGLASRPGATRAGPRELVIALGLGAVMLAVPEGARRLAAFDNYRFVLLSHGALLARAVEVGAWVEPPKPLAAEPSDTDAPLSAPVQSGLDARGRSVLLVTIDALRADHLGAYGYRRPTSPEFDALAKDAVVFDAAYCATPHTSYSVTSLMTGKYIRPLLLQGAGEDSDTWAAIVRRYGYRTAAFYPPAVFFIDRPRFARFESQGLGFEYRKVEFLEGPERVAQVEQYLKAGDGGAPVFLWVHLFGPHEPYEAHPEFAFGDRDVDRYDSEIAFADRTLGQLVRVFRAHDPRSLVIVSSDHGEEFGDHGGYYHGSSVYEEQARVPLLVQFPGALTPHRVKTPVQTIDLLPTLLSLLHVPRRPRLRGQDLSLVLLGRPGAAPTRAFTETEDHTLLAQDRLRLVCARKVGACQLFDLDPDPSQAVDASATHPERARAMRRELQELNASHGRFETRGLRAEGKGWPAPVLRGIAGDGDAADELAELLDDADRAIRRKAAELLFHLGRDTAAPALRMALGRDEDELVRRWCALALTRMGQGAPLVYDLVTGDDAGFRRLAALVLAEQGDGRGRAYLVDWWMHPKERTFEQSQALLAAFKRIKATEVVWPLTQALHDVRLRPFIADTLAAIGDDSARGPLAKALAGERYQTSRRALARALVELGGGPELAAPLVRFLGVPDPLRGGVGLAVEAGILEHVGGPSRRQLRKLDEHATLGEVITVVVPRGGNGSGLRLLVRARNETGTPARLHFGLPLGYLAYDKQGAPQRSKNITFLDTDHRLSLELPTGPHANEHHIDVPRGFGWRPGREANVLVLSDAGVIIEGIALVPKSDEIPPPEPRAWEGERSEKKDAQ